MVRDLYNEWHTPKKRFHHYQFKKSELFETISIK